MDIAHSGLHEDALRGTVCVCTGAGNGGIGYGILEVAALRYGMHIACLDLHVAVVDESARRLRAAVPYGIEVLSVQCDVTRPEDLASAVTTISEAFPRCRIGALFANAGVLFPSAGVLRSNAEDWSSMFEVNVVGALRTIQAFAPLLKKSPLPSVICTTASIGGLARAQPDLVAYCSTKHALVAMTEALSFELARRYPQIRVSVCCPCIVATGLFSSSVANRAAAVSGDTVRAPVDLGKAPQADSISTFVTEFAMTPIRHAEQTWDRIHAGEFYLICDNIRPYVDHDFPLDGAGLVAQRFAPLLRQDFERRIDNSGAFIGKNPTPTDDQPMNRELRRRFSERKREVEEARKRRKGVRAKL